jgi:hypothetical protein
MQNSIVYSVILSLEEEYLSIYGKFLQEFTRSCYQKRPVGSETGRQNLYFTYNLLPQIGIFILTYNKKECLNAALFGIIIQSSRTSTPFISH